MIRYGIAALSFAGVFFFPWGYTAALTAIASFFFPPIGVFIGILYDVLYFAQGLSRIPMATIAGLLLTIAAYFIRRFVRSRISDFS